MSTRKVIGVDLSLTGTGVGVISEADDGVCTPMVTEFKTTLVKTGPVDAKNRPSETLSDRVRRSRAITEEVCRYALCGDLVVIEGLFTGPNAGRLIDRAATWWRVVDRCLSQEVPVAVVAPTALKLPIAGRGGASKTEMISAMVRLWPNLVLKTDNEVDAMACAHLGAVALGMDVPTLERHRQVKWTDWPDSIDRIPGKETRR